MAEIADAAMNAYDAATAAGWVDGGLGRLDPVGPGGRDPFASLSSSAAAPLAGEVAPLRQILDSLDGRPAGIESYAGAWDTIAEAVTASHATFVSTVADSVSAWQGDAADAYRANADHLADALIGASTVASAIGQVARIMGQVVEYVREYTRLMAVDVVTSLIKLAELAPYAGVGPYFVAERAARLVAEAVEQARILTTRLDRTIDLAAPALRSLTEVFTQITAARGSTSVGAEPPLTLTLANSAAQVPLLGGADLPTGPAMSPTDRHTGNLADAMGSLVTPATHRHHPTDPLHLASGILKKPSAVPTKKAATPKKKAGTAKKKASSGQPASGQHVATPPQVNSPPAAQTSIEHWHPVETVVTRPPDTAPVGPGGPHANTSPQGGAHWGGPPRLGDTTTHVTAQPDATSASGVRPGSPRLPGKSAATHVGPDVGGGSAALAPVVVTPPTMEPEPGALSSSHTADPPARSTTAGDSTTRRSYSGWTGTPGAPHPGAPGAAHPGVPQVRPDPPPPAPAPRDEAPVRARRVRPDIADLVVPDVVAPEARPEPLVYAEPDQEYDIAVSFAGAQREYVESTVTAAKVLGLRVFYDKDMSKAWWGRNFVVEQRKIYGQRTLHFVPFISPDYLSRPFPIDEFHYAMLRSVAQADRHILPVLFGDVAVPPELLHPFIGYLRAEDHTPDELAEIMRHTVDGSRADVPPVAQSTSDQTRPSTP